MTRASSLISTQDTYTQMRRIFARERVEEHMRRNTMVLRKREQISEQLRGRELLSAQARPALNSRPVSTVAAPNMPSVEHLTEQILRRLDDQVRAYRERMGKSFS